MKITSLGAAAAVALLISGAAMAQQPMQQQPAQTPPASSAPAVGPAMAPAPTSAAPVAATPVPDSSQAKQMTEAAPAPTKVASHQSACQKAIKASERALNKSQASPEVIAGAWQHISTAKQEKGAACKDEAKAAQEML